MVTFQSSVTRCLTLAGRPVEPRRRRRRENGTGGGGGVVGRGPGENLAGTMIQRIGRAWRIGFVERGRAERKDGTEVEGVRVRR